MKFLAGFISSIVLIILLALIFIYSGVYDISAVTPHSGFTLWAVNTLKDNSIKNHADKNMTVPNMQDTARINMGMANYKKMCGCHGGPDREPGKGFYPAPPRLSEVADEWSPQELFWIIKHGLKMTGMPSFGSRASDDVVWSIVAFTKKLPTISKEEYIKVK